MRQIDHIIEEGKFLNKLKKFFAPISDEESKKMGVVLPRNRYKEQAKYKAKQPTPLKKTFKTDKSGTVRSADRYGKPVKEKPKDEEKGPPRPGSRRSFDQHGVSVGVGWHINPSKKKAKTESTEEESTKEKIMRPVDEAIVREADEPTDKATEAQAKVSNLTKQLTYLRKSWDANSSRVRKERKKLSTERDAHVRDARALATQREAADKARSKAN